MMDPYRAQPAEGRRRVDVTAPITHVTLLEDRAVVTRSLRVDLEAGEAELIVAGLSPVLIDKTLACAASAGVTIADVRIVRTRVSDERDAPVDVRELDVAVRAARERATRARTDERAKRDEVARLKELLALHATELAEDAAAGVTAEGAKSTVVELVLAARKAAAVAAALVHEVGHADAELARREAVRADADRPTTREQARAVLVVGAERATTLEASLRYVVPNACWRPAYRASLGPAGLLVEALAMVWQNTGEDWLGAKLAFSTERPSLGAAEPSLSADVLRVRGKRAIVAEVREQAVDELEGAAGTTREVPGIDDGGAPRTLETATGVDVPSSGAPVTAELFSFSPAHEIDRVTMPELHEAVVLRVRAANEATHVLLAGPVELVREGEIVGRGKLGLVSVGERFTVGFGPVPEVFVAREIVHHPDKSSLLGGWTTRVHDVRVRVANLGAEPVKFTIEERVPISELEKLKVSTVPDDTTDGRMPDANGFVTWRVDLAPYARRIITLRVVERRHSDVG